MSDVNELVSRIDGAFTAVKDRIKQEQQQQLQEIQERQKLLKEYEKVQAKIVEVAKPRLEALAKRAGERVKISPTISQTRRAVAFEFRSSRAFITLAFSVAPDIQIKNAVLEYDLKIVPVLWKFDSHAEFSTPIAAPDLAGLTKWLDDRIVGFVELYVKIHEGELYDQADYVEDPVAKVKFPKFAAGATLDHGGQTYFFIDDRNRAEFAKQKGIATA
jgi:YHS domain-containing protein